MTRYLIRKKTASEWEEVLSTVHPIDKTPRCEKCDTTVEIGSEAWRTEICPNCGGKLVSGGVTITNAGIRIHFGKSKLTAAEVQKLKEILGSEFIVEEITTTYEKVLPEELEEKGLDTRGIPPEGITIIKEERKKL